LAGASFIVDTDAHSHKDLISQEQALQLAMVSGLPEAEALEGIQISELKKKYAVRVTSKTSTNAFISSSSSFFS